jgi:hypothetical protein
VVLITLRWSSTINDAAVSAIAEKLWMRFIALGKEMGLFLHCVCQDYVYKTENVFGSYGRHRVRRG